MTACAPLSPAPYLRLMHGDCLALLPRLRAGSVDMVFADLPYGVTANKWDAVIPFEPLWRELLRVGKRNCAYVFTATQPFATTLVNSQRRLFRYDLVWDKVTMPSGFLNARKVPLRRHEHVFVFASGATTYNPQMWQSTPYDVSPAKFLSANYGGKPGMQKRMVSRGERYPVSVIPIPRSRRERGLHPTQKPVALLEWLVKTYSNHGDVVLDPTMGSGTTGVACVNTDRGFVGIEQDAGYFDVARERICGGPA